MKKNTKVEATVEEGAIYKIAKGATYAGRTVEVSEIQRDGQLEVEFGVWDGHEFEPKAITGNNGKSVRRTIVSPSELAERLDTEGESMSDENSEIQDTTVVPVDDDGNEITGPQKGLSPEEKAKQRLEAEKEKAQAKIEKAQAKLKDLATKRAEKLKEAGKDVPTVKESEIAAQVSNGEAKKYIDLDKDQSTAAYDAIKELKKAYQDIKKSSEKLETLLKENGYKEAEIAEQYTDGRAKKIVDMTTEERQTAYDAIKKAIGDRKKADALAKKTELTAEEASERAKLEKVIFGKLKSYQESAFAIGAALFGINEKRLYRNTHKTFEAYVMDTFSLSRPYAYQVMNAAHTYSALTEGQAVDAKMLPSIVAAEAITKGVAGLLKEANLQDDPEVDALTRQLARNIHALAVQSAPVDKDGKAILSPSHLNSVFTVLNEVAKTGVVDIEGKSVPINLAAASIDEMITTESAEKVAKAKASLAERFEQVKNAAKEASASQTRVQDAISSATGNNQIIPDGVRPKLKVICSIHGMNELLSSSDQDVELGCGCVFLSTPEGYSFEKNKRQPDWKDTAASTATA